jgi:hypothetical protein
MMSRSYMATLVAGNGGVNTLCCPSAFERQDWIASRCWLFDLAEACLLRTKVEN